MPIKQKIDEFFVFNERDNKAQKKFYITDTGKCPRAIFFSFKGYKKSPLDPRMSRIFQKGNRFHQDLFQLLYTIPSIKVIATELHIPEHPYITGRADALLNVDGENYVMDIKSMNSFIFKKMENPQPENVQQVQLYLHFFNIQKGILFYIDKDRQEIKEYVVSYDPLMVHFLLQNFKKLKDLIDKNEVPPKITKNWQCDYCRFQEKCQEVGDSKTLKTK